MQFTVMNTIIWYFSTLSLNEGCQVNFQFLSPLQLKQDKTLEPFTSLIHTDWIHSWPQGASSHCRFVCCFCCECTFRIALHKLSWLTCKWKVALLFSRYMHLCAVSLIPLAEHDCLIEPSSGFYAVCWCAYSSFHVSGGQGEQTSVDTDC